MERKQGAAARPSRSIPRHNRPRVVVEPRPQAYMDVMNTDGTRSTAHQTDATGASTARVVQPARYFDMKPLAAPSKSVQRTAHTLKPISKVVVTPSPAPPKVPQPVAAPAESDALPPELSGIPDIAEPPQRLQHAQMTPRKKPKHKRASRFRKPAKHHVLHGMAVLLFIAGVFVAATGLLANQTVKQQASVLGAQVEENKSDGETLSEIMPMGVGGYSVAPDLPRLLHVPSLSVVSRVYELEERPNGSFAAPKNIYDVGWDSKSAKPTDKTGAMLINGYVSGPTRPGVFYGLKKLKSGDEIVLEHGDRQMTTFVVVRIETLKPNQVDRAKLLKSAEPGKLGLNLLTVDDEPDAVVDHQHSRVAVYTVQK
jgi:hypothetical protein